ncbi:hypothetical protein [Levilactobacillus namurensis]|uniref:hypothetical protein n=1 Tax=Levilactobacillus namurensis TaxID=380393 RepID=UPI0036F20054
MIPAAIRKRINMSSGNTLQIIISDDGKTPMSPPARSVEMSDQPATVFKIITNTPKRTTR